MLTLQISLLFLLHYFDKNIVVLTPALPSGRMRTILTRTEGEGEGRGRTHTRVHAALGCIEASRSKAQVPFSTPACRLLRTFFWRLENFSLPSSPFPSLAPSFVDSFIHKGSRVSRMYTLTFATFFIIRTHVYTMKTVPCSAYCVLVKFHKEKIVTEMANVNGAPLSRRTSFFFFSPSSSIHRRECFSERIFVPNSNRIQWKIVRLYIYIT